jgi:dienelactone hydrolase
MRVAGAIAAAVAVVLAGAGTAHAFDPVREAANVAKSGERERVWGQPGYQAELALESQRTQAEAALTAVADPERNFLTDLCNSKGLACAGDIRLNKWTANGHGVVHRVLWTARNGSTVSGRVWATRAGARKRPAVIITNGSIQASEELYWFAAQTLAKAGYVVVTFDPQMQGLSDTYGEGADRNEGFPSQTQGNTFYDWTQDAIDFLLSTPAAPFCARASRSGTSHCPKQRRRVQAGKNAGHNPLWEMVERNRIGIAGHSYGASGVSWMGQQDKRVDAVVAWDNLCNPAVPAGTGTPLEGKGCSRGATGPPPGHRVPSLGLTVDSTNGEPHTSDPDPLGKSGASRAFSRSGVDTGSLVIRGGTHFDFSYIPMQPFRATLRGADLTAWYTRAWFDRYVKEDPAADRQLLTTRWRKDRGDRRVDPAGGGNLFSYHYRSRLDVRTASGKRFACEDLRSGCAGMVDDDGGPAEFSYLDEARSPDRQRGRPRPALVSLNAARISGRRLRLRASVNPAAAGRRVRIRLRAGGRLTSFTAGVPRGGKMTIKRRLRGRAARARTGTVSVRLPASTTVQSGSATTRVGPRSVGLRPAFAMDDGRVTARGRLSRRAKGSVTVTLRWLDDTDRRRSLTKRVPIRRGRFATAFPAPYPVRFDGAQVTVAYRGTKALRGRQYSRFLSP